MVPVVRGLEEKYSGKVKFVYLNMDNPNTYKFQDTLGVYYQPEFYLLDADGNVLKKFVGYVSQDKFEAEFIKYIK
jgi:thioredoxin-like negative regulator of GroEL